MRSVPPKSCCLGLASVLWLCAVPQVTAQNPAAQAAIIQEIQDGYQRLKADVEDLQTVQAKLERQILALTEEVYSLREELAKAREELTQSDTVAQLAERVRKIEQDRVRDRDEIVEQLKKLRSLLVDQPARPRGPVGTSRSASERGYVHVVREGETLSEIVKAYREAGVKVTVDDVLSANENLRPRFLQVGQEVFIPKPSP
jgi:LysM repeat protein